MSKEEQLEIRERISSFITTEYDAEMREKVRKNKDHLVVLFSRLAKHDPGLSEYYLDSPESFLQEAQKACGEFFDKPPKKFTLRVKEVCKSAHVPAGLVRHNHIGKLVVIEGEVKQKSDVRPRINETKFECPGCGNIITMLQTGNEFKEPGRCSCGRKGHFKQVEKNLSDVYSIVIQEPVESFKGGARLAKFKILCTDDLANEEVEREVYQGCRVVVSGVIKEAPVWKGDKLTNKLDLFLDANFIKITNDTYNEVKISKEEEAAIKEFSKKDNRLQLISQSMYGTIYGYDKEKMGILLSLFGGVGKEYQNKRVRGDIHVLNIGDTGTSKSDLLGITSGFVVKSKFANGKGVSGVGLTATVVKNELLGGWDAEAGLLPLCHNGYAFIDELDKVDELDKDALHEAMEQQSVTVNKATVQVTFPAKTTIIAAANPKFGNFSEMDDIYGQMDLKSTLVNRFDLIFVYKTPITAEDNKQIALRIVKRSTVGEEPKMELSKDFITKYIAYAKRLSPQIPLKDAEALSEWYSELKVKKANDPGKKDKDFPITPRIFEALIRLSEAHAKTRLSNVCSEEDYGMAKMLIHHSLSKVAMDYETGAIDMGKLEYGITAKQKEVRIKTMEFIRESKGAHFDEVLEYLKDKYGYTEDRTEELIERMKSTGDIYENRPMHFLICG